MLKILVALVAAACIACATAPAAEQLQAIAPGVSVFGAPIGGLTSEDARAQIRQAFNRPLAIAFAGETTVVSPADLDAQPQIGAAVRAALTATPESRIGLPVTFSERSVADLISRLGERYDRAPREPKLLGASLSGPQIVAGQPGLAVDRTAMRAAIIRELSTGSRTPLTLLTDSVAPRTTDTQFGPVIVIDRATNTLRLFSATRLVRKFHVATGQAIYPTPTGTFKIVDKQLNPWWYPPASSWARGLKPVPPGPWNPLGTRWMGLSAPGVGIHGTDEDTSIGYSRSHGCIRMHVPDAEWLFARVAKGTPVVIL